MVMMPTIVPKGWHVVEPEPTKQNPSRVKILSRLFHVYGAAEEFLAIARRSGHPRAEIEAVLTADEVRL